MTENSTEKPKKKKRRRKKRFFLKFFIFLTLVIGIYIFLSSSFFNVTNFQISGNVHYTDSEIKNISGLVTGKNLFFETKCKNGRDKLLSTSYIRVANVKRKLPDTIVIEIEEREEFAAVPFGEEYIILDNEGLVLKTVTENPKLPLLTGLTIVSRSEGEPLSVEQGSLLNQGIKLLYEASSIDFYFERIYLDAVSCRAYMYYDQYYCQGTIANLLDNIQGIKLLVQNQYDQDIQRGCVIVGSSGYLSFTPQID